jgi:hypothetical protein
MVRIVATIRPDSWDFPLLLHVLGAMLLVGALILAASALSFAWRDGNAALVRLGYRSLLLGALPAWVLMRAGAAWIADKEHVTDSNDAWVGIGFTTGDFGLLVILISILLAGLAVRRGRGRGGRSSGGFGGATAILASLLVIAYLVTVWAMTTKPV